MGKYSIFKANIAPMLAFAISGRKQLTQLPIKAMSAKLKAKAERKIVPRLPLLATLCRTIWSAAGESERKKPSLR